MQLQDLHSPAPVTKTRDSRLAAELVAKLRSREDVAEAYGLSEEQLLKKLREPGFKRILQDTREAWESDSNTRQRVRAKAGLLVEDALLDMYSIATDAEVNASTRVSSFDSLTRVADVSAPSKDGAGGGSGFKVIINLPDKDPIAIVAQQAAELEGEYEEL
jgi:hypothetical protein